MRTLLIDNYDSYTYNLFQLIAAVNEAEPVVLRNDDPALAELDWRRFDNVVISPGPGRPQSPRDTGHVLDLLRAVDLPILGVCLGHQCIAHAAGARVDRAPTPRHGELTRVRHDGTGLFAGIPPDFGAVRYHSLAVAEPLPASLAATAWAEDGVLMALRHRELPRWGVQFHPESVATEHGQRLLENFRRLTRAAPARTARAAAAPGRAKAPARVGIPAPRPGSAGFGRLLRVLPWAVDTAAAFPALYGASRYAFWLDSSRVEPGLSRFSFLGDAGGPLSETLTYRVRDEAVTVTDGAGRRSAEPGDIFEVLQRRLAERRTAGGDLPFDLNGGYVGYFGYELKARCGAVNRHVAASPDAGWIFADRVVAVDHAEGRTYLLALLDGTDRVRRANESWLDRTATALTRLGPAPGDPPAPAGPDPVGDRAGDPAGDLAGDPAGDSAGGPAGGPGWDPERWLVRDRAGYLADIAECQRQLRAGESYEICLTDRLRLPAPRDDLEFYRRLRSVNPAPYAALLRLDGLTVFSSSPERFLRAERDGAIESKPIKGTAARHPDPALDAALRDGLAGSPKTQAENLMIVDLLRNDLGRVCEVGSVSVPSYLAVETYATVHQLVSTVRGRRRPEVGLLECVRSCFPGGSMTGAPKLRTMEIIDRLEPEARGVYSGAIGYFGLDDTADLSIVIRTAVRHGDELTIGAGGAIVLASTPAAEFDEMTLKARSTLRALTPELVGRVS